MKRRLIQGLLVAALLCGAVLLAHPTAAWALVGTGTQEDPYQISTKEELYWFAGLVNGTLTDGTSQNTAACAVLTTDITINEKVLDEDGNLISDTGALTQWTPIGSNYDNRYTGTFDGKGHTIKGLYIDSDAEYVGLFGYIGEGGTVKNLALADSAIRINSSDPNTFVGAICGDNWGSITNCHNSGIVNVNGGANTYVGGICGRNNESRIENCDNSGTVTGTDSAIVGGICGENWGRIENCDNSGTVTGAVAGGICGDNRGGSIKGCSNSGTVTGGNVGGICGNNKKGSITNCSNSSPVEGSGIDSKVGGICGGNDGGSITTCSNSGNVTSSGNVGGICGFNTLGTITSCSNSGPVTGSGTYVGGICGYNWGIITTCYWLATAYTGEGVGVNEAGATVTEVLSKNADQYASGEVAWLLNGSSTNGPWRQNLTGTNIDKSPTLDPTHGVVGFSNGEYHNCTYDVNGFCTNCGSYESAVQDDAGTYQISNAGQLYWFAELVNGTLTDGTAKNTAACAVLTTDITINENVLDENGALNSSTDDYTQWTPIGNGSEYTGTFDGKGHTIKGLYINSDAGYAGLFGCIGEGGRVQNLTLADSSINSSRSSGDYAYVGGICGDNLGSITNCHNSGIVNVNGGASTYVGGICGRNWNKGSIESCSNSGAVSGISDVGGICGRNDGSITSCSNSGAVTGSGNYVGGICGYNPGSIENCDNSGDVSGISDVGGLCGRNDGSITSCSNSGTVTGSGFNSSVGGICGQNDGRITSCSNSGDVSGSGSGFSSDVGGICGYNDDSIENCSNSGDVTGSGTYVGGICGFNDDSIENCSNSGDVSGSGFSSYVGGICGYNDDSIENCSNSGDVTGGGTYVGGICGRNDGGSITNCYWLNDTPGEGSGIGVGGGEATEKTTDQYASGEVAWLLNQWQDDDLKLNGKVWAMGEDGYPVLNGKNDNIVVKLTFNANTGKEEEQPIIRYGNVGDALPNVTLPEITGCTFAGWYDNEALSGDPVTTISANATGDQTYWAKWTAKQTPPPTIPPTVSEETIDAIGDAAPGETVTVDLSSGSTKLDKEVFETLAGKDVTLVVDLGDGVSWTVNGTDIPVDADFTDIDMGVTMNSDGIPVDIINAITGEHGSVQVELAHNGAFGFTMTLTAPVGEENAGLWANLYHYKVNDGEAGREGPLGDNEEAGEMTFETAAQIGDDGNVALAFSHASQYAIVIDDHNHGVVELPFTDVSEGDWFCNPVVYVYENGLMTGTSDTTFEPNTSLSRAMLVAVLHRLEGSPEASAGDFTDVADGDWYAQAVNWAASVGVVNGFDDGTFQPNTAITREQLAAILRNYAAYKGMDVSTSGDLSAYTDADSVSNWAKESVEWVVGSGLIGGYEDSTLRPQGTTTRAEVASVLQRYLAN